MDIGTTAHFLFNLLRFRLRDRWTRPQIEAYQTRKLHALRAYAYSHSPFYQRFHAGMMDRPLSELPVLTKALLMEQFDNLVTDRAVHLADIQADVAAPQPGALFRGRYVVNATSGSTGQPGLFLFNRAEWAQVVASFVRAYQWAGFIANPLRRWKIAIISSVTPWHLSAQLGASLGSSPWVSTLRLSATEPLSTLAARLNEWQPNILIAYPSIASLLAEEQRAGRLHIAPWLLFGSAEVLTHDTRHLLEQTWNAPLFDHYGATESGGLASECQQHTGLHFFEDLVLVENVDDHNRPVPPGVYGEKLLITVLFNRTQPLIRYELSDSLRFSSAACACGRAFTLVDGIQGRAEDILYLPALNGGDVPVHPNLFHDIMDTLHSSGWQVIHGADGLTILLSGATSVEVDSALTDKLHQAFAAQGVVSPPIHIRHVDTIPRAQSGKTPLIVAKRPHATARE